MILHGLAASPGIAIGPIFHFQRRELIIPCVTIEDPAAEWARFKNAVLAAHAELEAIFDQALSSNGQADAAIFEAHLMMLDDPDLHDAVKQGIDWERINAEAALDKAAGQITALLESLDDEYLSARAADVRDVSSRVLRILLEIDENPAAGLQVPAVIVAEDLTPSDTINLDKRFVLGFCTAAGGATSHTAILARSLGLPAVVGVGREILDFPFATPLILDGEVGTVLVNPDAATAEIYKNKQEISHQIHLMAQVESHRPAITRDGFQVEVAANIGSIAGAQAAREAGAEGVGLLRSEFLYLERERLPDEEEQHTVYKEIADLFGDQPVILRTLDVGGDKALPYLNLALEDNPFLGVRAIRLCLLRPDLFKPQLKAALRAGVGNNLKLMFPMVATVDEVRQARELLQACRKELDSEGRETADLEIGIMIEIPSAAIMADQLAEVVDFFSIGTNDLAQYTMAADRTNSGVAALASAFEPAVLRLISQVIKAAHDKGKWVGMCGEMAGEPLAIPILLGLGLDEFSMNPPAIPLAKQIIRSLSMVDMRQIAEKVLYLSDAAAVKDFVRQTVPDSPFD